MRNQTAPSNSFLATAKESKGDAPTAQSVFTELSPNENTNKLASNGSWSIAGSQNDYYLKNKEFNSGNNFLSLATTKTEGGNGQST